MKATLLIIDDDPGFREDLTLLLGSSYDCLVAADWARAEAILESEALEVVLLDLLFGDMAKGIDYLETIHKLDPALPVILITEHASVDTAVEAMKRGAFSYISKSTSPDELTILIEKARQERRLRLRTRHLQEEVNQDYYRILGESPATKGLRQKIAQVAQSAQTVLITGESGTGKELVARRIHQQSDRSSKPFIAFNCAAIPRDLLENELFGHEAGAFTGANKRKPGKLELAADGVLFFDEIGELASDAQGKLLRVLEEREYERVGGVKTLQTEARILAATNIDLHDAMRDGRFREDLFYRLEMFTIHVPPLRERKGDITLLVDHFLVRAAHEMKTPVKHFSKEALDAFHTYDWPGNIRELRNAVLSAALIATEEEIGIRHLNPRLVTKGSASGSADRVPATWAEMDTMRQEAADAASREVETRFLRELLIRHSGNISKAAEQIGIHRSNLHRMLKRCGLD
ncbi:sigma-54 dependent transcriptional regulator [bacterium]|nr:sigma-54 dependent transcriptional regulator [bacterium]